MTYELDKLQKLSDLKKLESAPPSVIRGMSDGQIVTAIIQVSEEGYVPPNVQVRARISPTLFTAEFPAEQISALENDKGIKSVSLARPQQLEGAQVEGSSGEPGDPSSPTPDK